MLTFSIGSNTAIDYKSVTLSRIRWDYRKIWYLMRDLHRSDHKKLGKSTVNKRKPSAVGAAKTRNARIPQRLNCSLSLRARLVSG